jgi:hypothetical protein
MNKVHHTPSLNYQRTGLRKQDIIEWDPAHADKTVYPVCGCENSTMATTSDADAAANTTNVCERVLVMMENREDKIKGVSAKKA